MHKQLTKSAEYKALVKKITFEITELDVFVRHRTAETYWRVGKFIHEHLLAREVRADYGKALIERLAQDVGRSISTFTRSVQFYRAYPILADRQELTWNHYKALITVKDETQRKLLEKRAAEKNWTSPRLQEVIRLQRVKTGPSRGTLGRVEPGVKVAVKETVKAPAAPRLSVTRARLYAYRILEPVYIHNQLEEKVVDLGFSNNIQARILGPEDLKAGGIIETQKSGAEYAFIRSDAKPRALYVFVALVERVVDADTLWLNVDCGFKVWTRRKIRLRGIDAPELATPEGKKAREFVEARLKGLNFVVIKTYKDDKYGRYLADVFYQAGEQKPQAVLEKGVFLNQELLDQGLAVGM